MVTRIRLFVLILALSTSTNFAQEIDPDLYNKVLGAIVGSAMGDAMGASTEMWNRTDREAKYGYISKLTAPEIEPSAEGVWDQGYPAGATTDDTRWKQLFGDFMVKHIAKFDEDGASPALFAQHILDFYDVAYDEYMDATFAEERLAEMKLDWIDEWYDVSDAFLTWDIEYYNTALSRFYGGDMLCAGMLYSPMVGLAYSGEPEIAYSAGFRLAIFDQGYAKDITALGSAMTAAAMEEGANPDSVLNTFYEIDPHRFSERRIFQRYSTQTLEIAESIVEEAKISENPEQRAWELLDGRNQQVSPHAQEVLLISLTAMIFADFDFQKAIEFMVNYGRDNDTTAAFAGTILGAYHGFEALPDYKYQVMQVAEVVHEIYLEELATSLTLAIQEK